MIQGGCGNQFFQYSFARYLSEKTGQAIAIDWSCVEATDLWGGTSNCLQYFNTVKLNEPSNKMHRGLQWHLYSLIYFIEHKILKLDYFSKKRHVYYKGLAPIASALGVYFYDSSFFPFKVARTKNILMFGYFESAEYFKEIDSIIKNELTVKSEYPVLNPELYDIINTTDSVCITIKRQDVENVDIADIYAYDISYFYNAIDYIKQKRKDPVFIVFSDDVEWCQKNFNVDGTCYYETGNNPIYEKIRLMSSCKHFIIHNSTFSWWAQHLSVSEDKIVIAPTKWMELDCWPLDVYEDNWIYQTPDGKFVNYHE